MPHVPRLTIDPDSEVPPYEQLRSQIAAQASAGDLPAGTRLGTVRQTATDLGLAVNTVARAYRELEADGVVVTEGRRGTFVRSGALAGTTGAAVDARRAATDFVASVRRLGLTRAEALRLVEETWT